VETYQDICRRLLVYDCYFQLFLTIYIVFCIGNTGHKSFIETLNTQTIQITARNEYEEHIWLCVLVFSRLFNQLNTFSLKLFIFTFKYYLLSNQSKLLVIFIFFTFKLMKQWWIFKFFWETTAQICTRICSLILQTINLRLTII